MRKFVFQLSICLTIFLTLQTMAHAASVFDRNFGTNGTVTTAVGSNLQGGKIKIQPDGKILILGTVDSNSSQKTVLVRYNANGSLDANFGNNGIVIQELSPSFEAANDLSLQSDGKIIVVGSVVLPATQSLDFAVARFNQNGTLDATFGTNGLATVNQSSQDIFNAVVVQPDNKIVAVGTTSQNNFEFAAIRFNANGTLDQSFSNGGLFFLDLDQFTSSQEFRAVTLFPNGRILIGGTALSNGGTEVLVLLEPNGTFAQDFANNGVRREFLGQESTGFNMGLAVLPDGRFLSVSRSLLRRYLSNGAADPNFRAAFATGSSDIVPLGTDLAVRSDGKFIVLNQGLLTSRYDTVLYDKNGRDINRAKNLIGNDIAYQPDDKFVIAIAAEGSFIVRRYVSISSPGTRIADFDYDDKTDLIVSRLGETVYVLRSSQSVISYQLNRSSGEGVRIIPEDYYSNNPEQFPLFYWRYSGQNNPAYFEAVIPAQFSNRNIYQWGSFGDIPIGGDYDGETQRFNNLFRKSTELAIFRPSTGDWWIYNRSNNTSYAVHWGANGDKPVPADYDYDGITDYAIYRPSTGAWWVHRSSDDSYFTLQFGTATDIPLTGDFDGDGRADFTVYRPSEGNWYQYLTTEGFRVVRFGLPTDIPVPGDYDGDGRHDVAVFRQGVWYILQSTEGLKIVQWGNATDSPVAVRYDQ
jgi:uncharacterized delta-60 repeat protein